MCSCEEDFDLGLLTSFKKEGGHSDKPLLGCESLPQFFGTIIIDNYWSEGKRERWSRIKCSQPIASWSV